MPEMRIIQGIAGNGNFANGDDRTTRFNAFESGGEVVTVQQHKLGFAEIAAVSRPEGHRVRVCARRDQANHSGLISHQLLGDVAKNAINCNNRGG